jgi:hypothetical protein
MNGKPQPAHDPLLCGLWAYDAGWACPACRLQGVAYSAPQLPGPQPWNQLAGTAAAQRARALGPAPNPLALALRDDPEPVLTELLKALAARPAACRLLAELLGRAAA